MELFVCFDKTNILFMPSGYVRQIASVHKCCVSQTGANVTGFSAHAEFIEKFICICVPPA